LPARFAQQQSLRAEGEAIHDGAPGGGMDCFVAALLAMNGGAYERAVRSVWRAQAPLIPGADADNRFQPVAVRGVSGKMSVDGLMDFSPEVAEARAKKKPIVALESTIITHGMPYPRNVETAQTVEDAVRSFGAAPATIAVVDGRFRIGLERKEIESLGQLSGGVVKASRRDLAPVVARRGSAGTTVAATMFVAGLAGVEIFATGGIGGVHRGAEQTFDISADLVELSRTRVAVVCAGAKSILDIEKTLEFLETQGVAIVGYRCDEFPAFYARSSGFKLEHRCDGLHDLARMIRLQRDIGPGGLLIANPVPEDHALEEAMIEERIAEAVAEAKEQGVAQKEATPFLLKRVVELTGGRSLEANIALIKNNAILAAQTAVELARV
jgi:pseudouridylate synthase